VKPTGTDGTWRLKCRDPLLNVVCTADITFHRDDRYEVIAGDEKFTVRDVSLVETDNKTILSCDVNGRTTRSNVVFENDIIHLFTLVCISNQLAYSVFSMTDNLKKIKS